MPWARLRIAVPQRRTFAGPVCQRGPITVIQCGPLTCQPKLWRTLWLAVLNGAAVRPRRGSADGFAFHGFRKRLR